MEQLRDIFGRLRTQIEAGESLPATCSLCDRPRRPGQRYCRECHAAYVREWRRARGGRSGVREARRPIPAAVPVRGAQRRTPGTCVACGSADVKLSHRDGTVVWLCPTHI